MEGDACGESVLYQGGCEDLICGWRPLEMVYVVGREAEGDVRQAGVAVKDDDVPRFGGCCQVLA